MTHRRKTLHDLIDEAAEEDLPLLRELVARFQRPLEFPLKPAAITSGRTELERRRYELILEAHMHARYTEIERQHVAKTAERLGVDPARIECAAGGGSIGEHDKVEMVRDWCYGPVFYRLNTFHVENHEIITFEKATIPDSGSELIYKVRVLTANAESEAELNVPF